MKKILMFMISAAFVGCTLDAEIVDRNTVDTYYNSEDQYQLLINGVYSTFTASGYHKNQWPHILTGYEDYSFNIGSGSDARDVTENVHGSSTAAFNTIWNAIYDGVLQANTVLAHIGDVEFDDEEEKERIIAECHFLRGVFYYDLVRTFGGGAGIPIITEPTVDKESAYHPQSLAADVYELIESDLLYAAYKDEESGDTRLPRVGDSNYTRERATYGAALAFLAEMYLTIGEWQSAYDYADAVIQLGDYKLVTDYANMWGTSNESNSEFIFSTSFIADASNLELGSNLAFIFNPNALDEFGGNLCGDDSGRGGNDARVEQWMVAFFNNDPAKLGYSNGDYAVSMPGPADDPSSNDQDGKGTNNLVWKDYRIESSLRRAMMTVDSDTGEKSLYYSYPCNGVYGTFSSHPNIKKYWDPAGVAQGSNGNDYPRMRLADMYLIKAEALNELGDLAGAITQVDIIRDRAQYADGTTAEYYDSTGALVGSYSERLYPKLVQDMVNNDELSLTQKSMRFLILQERAIEFMGEQKRWFDLIRMKYSSSKVMYDYMMEDYLPDFVSAYNESVSIAITMHTRKKYFPIPLDEINTNGYQQNPGY